MSDQPTSAGGRFLRLAGMTARIGGDMARGRLQRLWTSAEEQAVRDAERYARIGADIARTLGGMKGAVMKVGQIVSQYRDMLPPELVDALSQLQNEAPARPFEDILPRLHEVFGPDLSVHFRHIEREAMAAASLAQVHRAVTADGRDVVIKVQYPGVDAAIAADLRQLRTAFKLARVLPVTPALLDALFDEIRQSLEDELDYRKEADAVETFRAFHADDPDVVVPAVLPELSGSRVLTLSHEPGDPLGRLPDSYSQADRDHLGQVLFRAIGRQLFGLGWLHCDPHPGNFAARPDGRLVIYDFGCLKRVPSHIAACYRQLSRASLTHDAALAEETLIAMGARNLDAEAHLGETFYSPWLELSRRIFAETRTDFAQTPFAEEVMQLSRQALPHWRAFLPVPDTVMINRMLGGHYWNLRQIGAQTALGPLLREVMAQGADVGSGT